MKSGDISMSFSQVSVSQIGMLGTQNEDTGAGRRAMRATYFILQAVAMKKGLGRIGRLLG
jgi:hypothetical protein